MLQWLLKNRRQRLIAKSFPAQWDTWLYKYVLHYRLFNDHEQSCLRAGVQILIAEKYWEGCDGLTITDEMKVAIAGQASLMLMGIEHDFFRAVRTILLYPKSFGFPDDRGKFDGQSHHRGPIILSWARVRREGADPTSEDNLVIHEFAHQLDEMDGEINGTPIMRGPEMAERWHKGMTVEFEQLIGELQTGKETFLGSYAATDDAEFFSVASERFFMQPEKLRRHHPVLYELLVDYYRVSPLTWFSRSPRRR